MDARLLRIGIVALMGVILGASALYIGFILPSNDSNSEPADQIVINDEFLYYHGVNITWLGQAGFKMETKELQVYIDPYHIGLTNASSKADIIIATHPHVDHLSLPDIETLADNETLVYTPEPTPIDNYIVPAEELLALPVKINYVEPSDIIKARNVTLEFIPAYNINKYNPQIPGQLVHPPEAKWVGVIIDFGEVRIYHAGDSDNIPEIAQVRADIALLPIQGSAMMDPQEAAEAVDSLLQSSDLYCVIPMHYQAGALADFFAEKADCKVIILNLVFFVHFQRALAPNILAIPQLPEIEVIKEAPLQE